MTLQRTSFEPDKRELLSLRKKKKIYRKKEFIYFLVARFAGGVRSFVLCDNKNRS